MDGMLEIKLKQKGADHWEAIYAALEGETLNLFRDREAATQRSSRWPPISMAGAVCKENAFYRRKDHTFKLILEDGSQYLFAAATRGLLLRWVEELQPRASSSDKEESGRPSSVGVRGVESTKAPGQHLTSTHTHLPSSQQESERKESITGRGEVRGSRVSLEAERGPPPKPPHTYYDKHSYPDGETTEPVSVTPVWRSLSRSLPPSTPPPAPPQAPPHDTAPKDKLRKSLKKLFKK